MVKQHRLQATQINLSDRELSLLEKERNKHSISTQLSNRIDIILLSNAGQPNARIAADLGMTTKTVRKWRDRWASTQEKRQVFVQGKTGQGVSDLELSRYLLGILKDAPRSGCPKTFAASSEQQIIALACEKPIKHGIKMTDWTHEMLAKVAIAKKIVPSISSSQIGRILKNKPTPTAQERVLAFS